MAGCCENKVCALEALRKTKRDAENRARDQCGDVHSRIDHSFSARLQFLSRSVLAELAEEHGNKLAPARYALVVVFRFSFFDEAGKVGARNELGPLIYTTRAIL